MKVTLEMTAVDMAVIVDLLIVEKARLEKIYDDKRADYITVTKSLADYEDEGEYQNAVNDALRKYKLAQEEYEAVAQALEVWR